MTIYARLATTLNRALSRFGYRVTRLPTPPDNCRIRARERLGIDLVVDVGANVGQYATALRAQGYSGRIVSFEPLPDAFAALSATAAADPLWEVHNLAVGARPAKTIMHVSDNSFSSSLLKVTQASIAAAPDSRACKTVDIAVVALADYIANARDARIMLKIDTQGYEFEVLQGCGPELAAVQLLDVEMSLQALYEGQPLFDQVDKWITSRHFRRLGLDASFWNRSTGELLQVDGNCARS